MDFSPAIIIRNEDKKLVITQDNDVKKLVIGRDYIEADTTTPEVTTTEAPTTTQQVTTTSGPTTTAGPTTTGGPTTTAGPTTTGLPTTTESVPTAVSAEIPEENSSRVIITFSEDLDEGSIPDTSCFVLTENSIVQVGFSSSTEVMLYLEYPYSYEDGDQELDYTKPVTDPLQSAIMGKDVESFSNLTVTNNLAGGTTTSAPTTTT